jgi:hypothetical protein
MDLYDHTQITDMFSNMCQIIIHSWIIYKLKMALYNRAILSL